MDTLGSAARSILGWFAGRPFEVGAGRSLPGASGPIPSLSVDGLTKCFCR